MSVEEENAWQEPRARRNRRRGSGRAPHLPPQPGTPADDDSDSLSDFSLVDAGEEASACEALRSLCRATLSVCASEHGPAHLHPLSLCE